MSPRSYSGAYTDKKKRVRPLTPRSRSSAKTGVPIKLKKNSKSQKPRVKVSEEIMVHTEGGGIGFSIPRTPRDSKEYSWGKAGLFDTPSLYTSKYNSIAVGGRPHALLKILSEVDEKDKMVDKTYLKKNYFTPYQAHTVANLSKEGVKKLISKPVYLPEALKTLKQNGAVDVVGTKRRYYAKITPKGREILKILEDKHGDTRTGVPPQAKTYRNPEELGALLEALVANPDNRTLEENYNRGVQDFYEKATPQEKKEFREKYEQIVSAGRIKNAYETPYSTDFEIVKMKADSGETITVGIPKDMPPASEAKYYKEMFGSVANESNWKAPTKSVTVDTRTEADLMARAITYYVGGAEVKAIEGGKFQVESKGYYHYIGA